MTHQDATGAAAPSHPSRLEQAAARADAPPTLSTAAIGEWSIPAALWADRLAGHEPRNPFEMWLSLFPIAPLFGVRWIWSGASSTAYDAMIAARGQTEPHGQAQPREQAQPRGQTEPQGKAAAPAVSSPTLAAPPRPLSSAEAAARAELEAMKLGPSASDPASRPSTAAATASGQSHPLARGPFGSLLAPMSTSTPVQQTAAAPKAADVEAPANLLSLRPAHADDLTRINGVGPRVAQLLNELGVYHFAQIADMTPAQLRWIDQRLYVFKGRAERDAWVPQARLLAGRQ